MSGIIPSGFGQAIANSRQVVGVIDSEIVHIKARTQIGGAAAGYLAVILATACWGSSGIWIKFLVADSGISALALAFWRDLSTSIILFTCLAIARPAWLRVRRADLPWLLGMGGSIGLLHVCWNLGVLVNGAAVATVQQAAAPAIVAIVAWLMWGESLRQNKILAVILTFAGTVLVSGLDVFGHMQMSLQGYVIGLGIPIMYSCWVLFGKKVRRDYNPITSLAYSFAFGALVLLPLQGFTPQPWPVKASSLLWFAGLLAIPTIGGFISYTFALGHLPASVATILAMTEIVFVNVYTYILLSERLSVTQILGTVLVVIGVALLSWNGQRPKAPTPA
jgi:drug/metabolite transporter, DME family